MLGEAAHKEEASSIDVLTSDQHSTDKEWVHVGRVAMQILLLTAQGRSTAHTASVGAQAHNRLSTMQVSVASVMAGTYFSSHCEVQASPVVLEDGVLVNTAWVLQVVCAPDLNIVHGEQLEGHKAKDGSRAVAKGHGALQGCLIPEHIWPHDFLHAAPLTQPLRDALPIIFDMRFKIHTVDAGFP